MPEAGKISVINEGNNGIGRTTATEFARSGIRVVASLASEDASFALGTEVTADSTVRQL